MAQVSRSTFASSLAAKIDSNGANGVTAQDVREVLTDLEDSATWYDEAEVSNDTTPQLGGNLDVNGNAIVSASNGDIAITPNGTGSVVLDGLNWPQADGTSGQSLITDGAGQLSWSTITGGGSGTTEAQVKAWVGDMVSGNTEDGVTVTYQSADNTLDFAVDRDLSNYTNTPAWIDADGAPVQSVATKTGDVVLDTDDIISGTFDDARISESSVTQHQAALSVAATQVTGTLSTTQYADESVTLAKMQHIATGSLLGRSTASTGDVEVLTTATILKQKPESITIAVSDETTDLTTGTAKVTFRMPYAFTLTAVRASVNTAPVGSTIVVDINESGTTILSTKLSIDAGEKTSTTAASAAVISVPAFADDDEISFDIDQIGSSTAGKGLKVTLIGTQA